MKAERKSAIAKNAEKRQTTTLMLELISLELDQAVNAEDFFQVKFKSSYRSIEASINEDLQILQEIEECIERERYYLKAMNCPHHHRIFAAEPRSYRDLPLRLAEYGTNYRYEQSGELFGLMRVRSLNMNDAHIYCTPEQFAQEFNAVNEMYLKYFKIFGIEKYVMRFSTHDPSRLTGDKQIRQRTGTVEADRGHGPQGVD